MLSTWKIFPKGLLLYSDNFLISDERQLPLGLILKVLPVFMITISTTWERAPGGQVYSVIQMAWLTCGSLLFLGFVILSIGTLSSNLPLITGILTVDTLEMTNQD